MKNKSIIALLAATSLSLLAGCSSNGSNPTTDTGSGSAAQTESTAAESMDSGTQTA